MATKKSSKKNIEEELTKLRLENQQLKQQLKNTKNSTNPKSKKFTARNITKWASLSLAGAIFIVASFVLYAGNTIVNTDRFMKVAAPLIEQPAVQQAVADRTTAALFEKVDVEGLAIEVLPQQVDFLAPALANQIQSFTKNQAVSVLQNPSFQQTWNNLLQNAHQKTIEQLKNYEGDGTIDVNDAFQTLSQRLEDSRLGFLAGKSLPPKVGDIVIIQADWLPYAHTFVSNFQTLRLLTFILFVLLLVLAYMMSRNKRRVLMQIGWMLAILSFVMLVSLRILKNLTVENADPTNQAAVLEIANVLTRPLAVQIATSMFIGLAIVLVAWIGGKSRGAVRIRKAIDALIAGKLHESLFTQENGLTRWFGKFQRPLLILIGIFYVLSFLIIDLSLASIIVPTILAAILALIVVALSATKK